MAIARSQRLALAITTFAHMSLICYSVVEGEGLYTVLLKDVAFSSVKVFATLPAGIGGLGALREIAEKAGFDKSHPDSYAKLSGYINVLLYVFIEHWLAYTLLSIFGGTVWALFVIEPKAAALKAFQQARKDRIGE